MRRELSSSRTESIILDVYVNEMEAGLAGGPGKFQSRQLHSASEKLPRSFCSLRDSLFAVAWRMGSC